MEAALGLLLVLAIAGSGLGAWRLTSSPRRVLSPEREAMRSALHHAIATLPHLRRGLDETSAKAAAPHLRALTQATAVAITDGDRVLALDGISGNDASAAHLRDLSAHVMDGRVHVQPRTNAVRLSGSSGAAVVAPLVIQDENVGALIALYDEDYRLRPDDARVVGEAAALVSAQVELSVVADQEERLTRAELHALRARFRPTSSTTRSLPSRAISTPTLNRHGSYSPSLPSSLDTRSRRSARMSPFAEELHYVEKYLRLEQARFRDRLTVRVQVDPDVLQTVVPVLSLQPLVENAVKHGVETRSGQRTIEIVGFDRDVDVELRVRDDGIGMSPSEVALALSGEAEGTGLHNVDRRLRAAFGENYGLEIETEPTVGPPWSSRSPSSAWGSARRE